ncbi:MAG: amidohydrolase, partial [Deltaproteobacteria bacterium]|nr:amidohydrolase [Deltaproteobacteria bacterium]
GGIILPGLVNTHTHAPMSLFRGLADDLPLMAWLNEHIFAAERQWVTPETVFLAALLSCAEMLLSGTTTCCDGYFFEDQVTRAMERAGMRCVVGQGVIDFPAPGVPDPQKNVAEAQRFIETWQQKSPLITPGVFCHAPYTCSKETLKAARRLADETGCLLQIHVAETRAEAEQIQQAHGCSPVQFLDALGILNQRTLAVHVIWVDEADVKTLAQRDVAISVTTESEMKLASGIAPVPDFVKEALRVGLGTDGCASNNNLDLFQEMDLCAKLHKVHRRDPTVLNARQVLRLATQGGADAIGLGSEIGSIEEGKQADLIIIDTHKPHWTPLYDPASHVVYAAGGGDVNDVIIAGRVVVKDRQVLTMDVETVMAEVKDLAIRIAGS